MLEKTSCLSSRRSQSRGRRTHKEGTAGPLGKDRDTGENRVRRWGWRASGRIRGAQGALLEGGPVSRLLKGKNDVPDEGVGKGAPGRRAQSSPEELEEGVLRGEEGGGQG